MKNTAKDTTRTAIDASGRLVIPRHLREKAALRPGDPLSLRFRDGCIEIEPAPREVTLVKRGVMTVAMPVESTERLSEDVVTSTRDELRAARGLK